MLAEEERSARERGLELLHFRNLRDLGGLPAQGGQVVASGRLFRGSSPSRFEQAERQALQALELRTIIDLRMHDEVVTSGIQQASPTLRVHHHPLFESARQSWIAPKDQSPPSTASRYFEMLNDGVDALANIVLRMAQPETTPLLFCCAAGRDRTGIVAACLLDLLGVDDALIAHDYAQSDAFVHDGGRAHSSTIVELLKLVRQTYGSTRSMVQSFGVSDAVFDRLELELLCPAPETVLNE
jgi:protein-tyrosine phosphatase